VDWPVTHEVNLCSVVRRPRVYRGNMVEIRADILLALPHGGVFFDKSCPKTGIQLGVVLPNADASVTDMVPSILNDCSTTTRPETVAGTFIGKLSYAADGRLNLRLVSARDLDVKPCVPPTPQHFGAHAPPPLLPYRTRMHLTDTDISFPQDEAVSTGRTLREVRSRIPDSRFHAVHANENSCQQSGGCAAERGIFKRLVVRGGERSLSSLPSASARLSFRWLAGYA